MWTLLGLAVGGAVLSNAFRMAAQTNFDAALQADMDGLISAAEPDPNGGVMLAGRFLNHNFDRVYSGLYYQIRLGSSGGQISRSLFDKEIEPVNQTRNGALTWGSATGPEDQHLRVVSRRVDLTPDNRSDAEYTFMVAGDMAAVERQTQEFNTTLLWSFGLLGLGLITAILVQVKVGLLDLQGQRLALIAPDRGEYAASVAKIGILLAYFQNHPEAATNLTPQARHELGLMVKSSSNEMAAKYSRKLGLKQIQAVLNQYQLYDTNHGGGLWVGKHYGKGGERYGDPLNDNSHAVTVRQVLRFYLWLDQGRLVSNEASMRMREIFASPELPHDPIKFVKALEGRGVTLLRKWGTWEDWHHDTALSSGPGRRYILVGLTRHPRGDDYLVGLAQAVDDLLQR